jgi:hypothetical protein
VSTRTQAPPIGPAPMLTTPRVMRQRRVSRGLLSLALALAAVFGLGIAALVLVVSKADPYLAAARDMQVGQQITAQDLRTVYISAEPGLAVVPAAQKSTVVGKYAATNLTAGSLLTPRAVTAQAIPGPGRQIVGVSLKPGQVPASALKPGAAVLLVATAAAQGTDTTNPPPPLPQFQGTVVFVVTSGTTTQLSVAVDAADAPNVARLAADGRIVVTLAGS